MTCAPINLLPRTIYAERARQRAIRIWSGVVGLCLFAMLGMIVIGAGSTQAPDTTDLQGRLSAANQQTDQLVLQISRSRQRMALAQRELASANQVVEQPDLSLLLQIVGQQLGQDAMLSSVRIGAAEESTIRQVVGNSADPSRRWLVVTGIAEDHQAVPAIVLRLEALGLFEKVVLQETFPETYQGLPRVGFRVACQMPLTAQKGAGHE